MLTSTARSGGPAVFTFEVGASTDRPIRPDSARPSWVTIAGEDTPTSYAEARTLAAQMAGTRHAMVTSVTLVAVEL